MTRLKGSPPGSGERSNEARPESSHVVGVAVRCRGSIEPEDDPGRGWSSSVRSSAGDLVYRLRGCRPRAHRRCVRHAPDRRGRAIGAIGGPFPFLPRQLTLIGTFSIGIPGFFLALSPEVSRVRSGFLGRVLRFSIPVGAVAGGATLAVYEVARRNTGTTLDEA